VGGVGGGAAGEPRVKDPRGQGPGGGDDPDALALAQGRDGVEGAHSVP
jgi:hypothetical protein